MRSSGVGAAGGVGELITDCITTGRSKFDMYNLDIQRFLPIHNNRYVEGIPFRLKNGDIKNNLNEILDLKAVTWFLFTLGFIMKAKATKENILMQSMSIIKSLPQEIPA